jgi:peptidoglycan/xylan/chitin deacetylase (PgdA/CDA1 family)
MTNRAKFAMIADYRYSRLWSIAWSRVAGVALVSGTAAWLSLLTLVFPSRSAAEPPAPVPERLVVLTFDDGVKSHGTLVAPLLKRYGFGATFFITEASESTKGWHKERYLTWDEVRKLHADGFEIGNHSSRHRKAFQQTRSEFRDDLMTIERRFAEHGIPAPKTFCYPAYYFTRGAVEVLQERGYVFARRGTVPEMPYEEGGLGFAYDPREDHPLLIPIAGAAGPKWQIADFITAVEKARAGRIAVLAFHGVPDLDHPWVSTEPERFAAYMSYLHEHQYTVIALRDLARYVAPGGGPRDPLEPIERRLKLQQRSSPRPPGAAPAAVGDVPAETAKQPKIDHDGRGDHDR